MNLWYLGKDDDRPYFKRSGEVKIVGLNCGPTSAALGDYNAFSLSAGASIRLCGASRWYPVRHFETYFGWLALCYHEKSELIIELVRSDNSVVVRQSSFNLTSTPVPVTTPYLPDSANFYDIVIRAPEKNSGPVLLGVMQNMKHDAFYNSVSGKGIEIGPGLNPRIKSSGDRTVTYLERYDRDTYLKFNPLYKTQSSEMEALWDAYKVGSAHEIPVDLGQLDFIFSSHMIEHLPNPLGHFKLWKSRLKPTGQIFGLLPCITGCFDFMHYEPTQMSEWISLFRSGDLTKPQIWQYDKYQTVMKRTTADMAKEDIRPHFSLFNAKNLSQFLKYCCDEIGYSDYGIRTAVNNVSIEFYLKA